MGHERRYGNLNDTAIMIAAKAWGMGGVQKQLQARWERGKALPVWGFKRAARFLLKCKTSALIFDRNWGDEAPEPWDTGYALVNANTESGCDLDAKVCWVTRATAQALKDYRCVGRNEYGGYRKRAIYARDVEGCKKVIQTNFKLMRQHVHVLRKAKRANLKLARNIDEMADRLEAFGIALTYYRGGGGGSPHPSSLIFSSENWKWGDPRKVSISGYRIHPRGIAKSVEVRLHNLKMILEER